jgi:hypothetical protein
MPIYVDNIEVSSPTNATITDFKFINKIENLLYQYDLVTTSPI